MADAGRSADGARWAFYAIGEPAPQGSKSYVGRSKTGKAIMKESSQKVKPWREAVKDKAFGAGPMLDGPIAVTMVFTLRRPQSTPKSRHTPQSAPDLSKLIRATEDAITQAGLWKDDARVARITAEKVWPSEDDPGSLPVPGVIVAAREIAERSVVTMGTPLAEIIRLHDEAWTYFHSGWLSEYGLALPVPGVPNQRRR